MTHKLVAGISFLLLAANHRQSSRLIEMSPALKQQLLERLPELNRRFETAQ